MNDSQIMGFIHDIYYSLPIFMLGVMSVLCLIGYNVDGSSPYWLIGACLFCSFAMTCGISWMISSYRLQKEDKKLAEKKEKII